MASTAGLAITDKPGGALKKLDIQSLIEQAVANNAGVDVLERIFSLAKDVRAEQAKEAWNRAMVEFQKACPVISKNGKASIQAGAGRFSYTYATLDSVMGAIVPLMTELDLSVSWRHRVESGKVTANCRISHGLGHFEESGEVAMPIGEDRSGANAAQKVGIALTYAKRYSLLSIVGIAPEDDPDAQGTDAAREPEQRPTPKPTERPTEEPGHRISEAQQKRLWAIAYKAGEQGGMGRDEVADRVAAVCEKYGFDTTKVITSDKYNAICDEISVPF
jgi:ERF superfamily protein